MQAIIDRFITEGKAISCAPYGEGLINDTYKVVCDSGAQYILQRVNDRVFRDPVQVMANINAVTEHIRAGGAQPREVLRLIKTREGLCYLHEDGSWWRMYDFISGSVSYRRAVSREMLAECARAFGGFMNSLADFPAESLFETISGFHDTPRRYEQLKAAVRRDSLGRAGDLSAEIDFLLEREARAGHLMSLLRSGELPLRVTHNDTKLDNVLFDAQSGKALCIVDLDTVMPGLSVTDFGDSVRSGASTVPEDGREPEKAHMNLDYLDAYAEGYLAKCGASLTKAEKAALPLGIFTLPLELGLRYLQDYIEGDVYFKTKYPGHNLDRFRIQRALVEDIERNYGKISEIIYKYC